MAEELPITITIAGRPYRLTIARDEEEIVRKAAKNIEAQISHYGHYNSDKQDLLAMVALHFATSAINNENEVSFVTKSLSPTLTDLDKILTKVLED